MSSAVDTAYGLDLAAVDPASLNDALRKVALALAKDPARGARAFGELAIEQGAVALDVLRSVLGANGDAVPGVDAGDRRFADRAWAENPLLRGLLGSYTTGARWTRKLVEEADVDEATRRKARFALGLWLDAVAPSNVAVLNPTVVKEAVDTGGLSLLRGASNWFEDLVRNRGMPKQVDREPFELGTNMAATPGRVVYRNELMELIAYEPQTETVYAQPFVYSPPWINKYYVMDLAPGRSFVEYAVRHGFTVFAISYRNPDESMRDLTLDDYLRDGWLAALEQASRISGSDVVNVLAVCLGGTLTMMGAAVLAARGEQERVGWIALTNSMVDFCDPGDLGVFADEKTIERIEKKNAQRGYLDSKDLESSFTWLRGNDLVWNYVVSNWMMGKQPPAFDILAWNADSTRLPAKMHSQYLRACYLNNELVQPGAFTIDGTPVDMRRVDRPLFLISAENDHIAPWRTVYRTTQVTAGDARFVLSSGGHVAGMVNPPGPKARYRTRDDNPADPDEWLAGAETVAGSWWEAFVAWAGERSGERVAPPALPDGEPAPGTYVRS